MSINAIQSVEPDADIEVTKCAGIEDAWSVEIIDYENEGSVYVTVFHGPDSYARAREYADWKRC